LDKKKNLEYANINLNVCLDFFFEVVNDFDYWNETSDLMTTRCCNETVDEDNMKVDSSKRDICMKKKIRVVAGSVGVEKFEVEEHKPYPAISDHCGVYCSLEIINEQEM
jgi:hypothetical protein